MRRKPARVLHVVNSIGLGGVPEAAYQLLKGLPSERFERHLAVLRPLDVTDAARLERFEKFRSLDIPIFFVPPGEHKLATVTALSRFLAEQPFDIVHAHSYRPNLFARLSALVTERPGARIVGHYHNQYDANWERDGTVDLDRLLAARCDRLIACSSAVRDHVAERFGLEPSGISVIPNGVDIDRFRSGLSRRDARAGFDLPEHGPVMTLVGRICPQKGQLDLARAAPEILEKHPAATFVFAGMPDEKGSLDELRKEIDSSGYAHAFRFLGFVERMADLYAATDVLVAPSRWEGFGLMLVEAMAAGVPIVATRTGGIPEVVGEDEGAVIVDVADIGGLARAINRIVSNTSLSAKLGELGKRRSERFIWRNSVVQLSDMYDEILKQ